MGNRWLDDVTFRYTFYRGRISDTSNNYSFIEIYNCWQIPIPIFNWAKVYNLRKIRNFSNQFYYFGWNLIRFLSGRKICNSVKNMIIQQVWFKGSWHSHTESWTVLRVMAFIFICKVLPMNEFIRIQLNADNANAKKRPTWILCRRHFSSLKNELLITFCFI